MGSRISGLLIEPLLGVGAIALAIYALIEENKREEKSETNAYWLTIASIGVLALLIIINIIMTMFGG